MMNGKEEDMDYVNEKGMKMKRIWKGKDNVYYNIWIKYGNVKK
jgi:hypothetical protein